MENMVFIMVFVILGIVGVISILAIIISSNTKVRAKSMEKQVKAVKYMMDENKDILKEMSTQSAEISSEGIEIKARAMKKGFSSQEEISQMFCKHCGKTIEKDSKFCNYCGKEQ